MSESGSFLLTLREWLVEIRDELHEGKEMPSWVNGMPVAVIYYFLGDYLSDRHGVIWGRLLITEVDEAFLKDVIKLIDDDLEQASTGNMPDKENLEYWEEEMDKKAKAAEEAARVARDKRMQSTARDRFGQLLEQHNKQVIEGISQELVSQGVEQGEAVGMAEEIARRAQTEFSLVGEGDLPGLYGVKAKEVIGEIRDIGDIGGNIAKNIEDRVSAFGRANGELLAAERVFRSEQERLPDPTIVALIAGEMAAAVPIEQANLINFTEAAVLIERRARLENFTEMTRSEREIVMREIFTTALTPLGEKSPIVSDPVVMSSIIERTSEAVFSVGEENIARQLHLILETDKENRDDLGNLIEEAVKSRRFFGFPAGKLKKEEQEVLSTDIRSRQAAEILAAYGKSWRDVLDRQEILIISKAERESLHRGEIFEVSNDERVIWIRKQREELSWFTEIHKGIAGKVGEAREVGVNEAIFKKKGPWEFLKNLEKFTKVREKEKTRDPMGRGILNRYLNIKKKRAEIKFKGGKYILERKTGFNKGVSGLLGRLGRTTFGKRLKIFLAVFSKRAVLSGVGGVAGGGARGIGVYLMTSFRGISSRGQILVSRGISQARDSLGKVFNFRRVMDLGGAGIKRIGLAGGKLLGGSGGIFTAAGLSVSSLALPILVLILGILAILVLFVLFVLIISFSDERSTKQYSSRYIRVEKTVSVDALSGTTFANNVVDNNETAKYTINVNVTKPLQNLEITDVTTVTRESGTVEVSRRFYNSLTDPDLANFQPGRVFSKTYELTLGNQLYKDSYLTNVVIVKSGGEETRQVVILTIGKPPISATADFAKGLIDLMVSSYNTNLMTNRNLGIGGDLGGRLVGKSVGGRVLDQGTVAILSNSATSEGALQCVGFVLAVTKGIGQSLTGTGDAKQFFGRANSGWLWHSSAEIRNIKPGDVFVSRKGVWGHIAIVYAVTANGFSLAEAIGVDQNLQPLGLIRYGQSFYAFEQIERDPDYGFLAYGR